MIGSSLKAATIAGLFAVLVWGSTLAMARLVVPHLGLPLYIALVFLTVGIIGVALQVLRASSCRPNFTGFSSRYFWMRGFFFAFHEVAINVAVTQVSHDNVPLILLINYLWPTAIILCSVLLAGVKIHRPFWFVLGTIIVLGSLSAEILGPGYFAPSYFKGGDPGFEHSLSSTDVWMAVLTFAGAISWGLYSALTKRFGDSSGGSRATPYYQIATGIIAPILLSLLGTGAVSAVGEIPWFVYGFVTYIIVSQFVAFQCWDAGVSRGNIVILSLFADFIPWISLAFAAMLLGSEISLLTMISAVALVAGAMVTRYGTLARAPASS